MPIASNPRCGKRKLRSVGMKARLHVACPTLLYAFRDKAGPNMGIMNGHPARSLRNPFAPLILLIGAPCTWQDGTFLNVGEEGEAAMSLCSSGHIKMHFYDIKSAGRCERWSCHKRPAADHVALGTAAACRCCSQDMSSGSIWMRIPTLKPSVTDG